MTIAYNEIPNNLRLPGSHIEFDASQAGSTQRMAQLLVFGNMLSTGTAAPLTAYDITDPDQAAKLFGAGSQLAAMLRIMLKTRPQLAMVAMGASDAAGAAKATCPLLIQASNASAGVLPVYVNGLRVAVPVAKDDDAATIGANVAAMVNANEQLEMTAAYALDGSDHKVTFTSKNACESANDIGVHIALQQGDEVPEGLTLTLGPATGGTINPDVTDVLASLGDQWYQYFVCPWTDATNLQALENELDNRWGAMVQKDGRVFIGTGGDFAAAKAFGSSRNSSHVACMGTAGAPQAPYLWAAAMGLVAANALQNDPARPLKTLALKGILPPAREQRFSDKTRNLLLFEGISTFTVAADGTVVLEKVITMYQQNAQGFDDTALLAINTPETLSRLRYEINARTAMAYPRHKLASDGTEYPAGQPIVTPMAFKGFLITLYKEFIDAGWVEDLAHFKETLVVERDNQNANRLNYVFEPDLVNQFEIAAGRGKFLV